MKVMLRIIGPMLIIAVWTIACAPQATTTPEPIVTEYLNDLDPVSVSTGFSELGRGINPWSEAPLVAGEDIQAHGKLYSNGLFAHAPARIDYRLNGVYSGISGYVLVHDGIECGDGVKFELLADNRELFASGTMTSSSDPIMFEADLTGVQSLTLNVDSLGNIDCDWSVWGDPILIKGGRSIGMSKTSEPTLPPVSTSTVRPKATSIPPTLTPTPLPPENAGWMPEGVSMRFGKGRFFGAAASPDNSIVALAAVGGIYLTDPLTGRVVGFIETSEDPKDVEFSKDGEKIFIGTGEKGVEIWKKGFDSTNWQFEIAIPDACAYKLEVSPDGQILLAKCFINKNSKLTFWDLSKNQQYYYMQINTPNRIAFDMAFPPDNSEMVVIATNDIIRLVDSRSGEVLQIYNEPKQNLITDIDFSPDGKTLAVSPYSPAVILLSADTLDEIQRNDHSSDVYLLSFMDNQTILTFNKGEYIVQKISGEIVRAIKHGGEPIHVYVPKHNVVAFGNYWSVDFVSLDTFALIGKTEGFHPYRWVSSHLSPDGNTFIGELQNQTAIWVAYADNPDKYEVIDLSGLCSTIREKKHLNIGVDFLDYQGKYLEYYCTPTKTLNVYSIEAKKVVKEYKNVATYIPNNVSIYHPWKDSQAMQALTYENPDQSNGRYKVEIWDLLADTKITSFNVDTDKVPSATKFSPSSSYYLIFDDEKKSLTVYEISTGKKLYSLPFDGQSESLNINELDTLLFIIKDGYIKAYSMATGETVQKLFVNTGSSSGMDYFDADDMLVWFYGRGEQIFFDYYNFETGKKIAAHVVENPGRTFFRKIILPQSGQGKVAVIYNAGSIDVMDLETETSINNYTWNAYDDMNSLPPYFLDQYMFVQDNPILFKWMLFEE